MRKSIFREKALSFAFLVSFALVLGGTIWAYVALHGASGPIIVRFNEVQGITLLGSFWTVIGIGVTGLVLIILNFFLALAAHEREAFWGYLLGIATVFLSILLFAAMVAIISVN